MFKKIHSAENPNGDTPSLQDALYQTKNEVIFKSEVPLTKENCFKKMAQCRKEVVAQLHNFEKLSAVPYD